MSWDRTPWVIGGGAEHSPEVARVMAYASTSGAEGVVQGGDLKVRATATPTTAVTIAPGAALIRNRYAGGDLQSYTARNTRSHSVTVTPTTSSGSRSDLVVARINDPQYAGPIPADPLDFDYVSTEIITGVGTGKYPITGPLNLGYPAIALARINLPASTATVTPEMIEDVRRIALPRKDRQLFGYNLVGADEGRLTHGTEQTWPSLAAGLWLAYVPEWATKASIVATWGGVRMVRSSASGTIWVRLGGAGGPGGDSVRTAKQKWDGTMSARPSEEMRESWTLADGNITIPKSHRGTEQPIRMLGSKLRAGGSPTLDSVSSVMVDIEFLERPM